jgi:hypothetical protein
MRRTSAERYGYAAGAACKNVEARKTSLAAPVSFSRFGSARLLLAILFVFLTKAVPIERFAWDANHFRPVRSA